MSEEDLDNPWQFMSAMMRAGQAITRNYMRNFSGYQHDARDIFLSWSGFMSKLAVSPSELFRVQDLWFSFLQKQCEHYSAGAGKAGEDKAQDQRTQHPDKRFSGEAWQRYPYFSMLKDNYLLFDQFISAVVNGADMSERQKRKLYFYTRHYLDLLSPSNFLLTNPEALELAADTGGKSLRSGFMNFVKDLEKGGITQTDETAFAVGKNLAVTPGAVVFRNDLFELIQYNASTEKAHEVPLLIVPPWINKYYILDLQPADSLVKFLVDQGFTVFMISWVNPSPGSGDLSFDDYVQRGALAAAGVVKEITGAEKVNAMGYCLGGTLLGVSAAIAETRKESVFNSLTFLAAMIDFSDIGPMGDVIDSALVNKLERGELLKDGLLAGGDMEKAFNLIRANDLVWHYAVNNYLKGKQPEPFDVLYWTNDNTNLPASMYLYYMRHMILENKLSRKNALRICNTPVDVGGISAPAFVIAFKEDHISPPATVFTTTELLSGPVEFILGESGHVMGVANPPSKKKYGHFINGAYGSGLEKWKDSAAYVSGTWWLTWSERLRKLSGRKVSVPAAPGSKKYRQIGAAPGEYVLQQCSLPEEAL